MALGTYTELQASVLKDLMRASDTDASATYPDWVLKFEAHARRELATALVGETVQQATTISDEYTTLPDDCIGVRAASITVSGVRLPMVAMSPRAMDDEFGVETGIPSAFCVVGSSLRVAAVPNASFQIRLVCATLPALSVTNTTNWLLTAAPDLYEAGILWKAQEYYKSFDEAARLEGQVAKMISRLISQAKLNMPTSGMTPRIFANVV